MHSVRSNEGIDRFLGQGHAVGLAAQVGKFDEWDRIIFRVNNQGSD
jgi:hypothetical protein